MRMEEVRSDLVQPLGLFLAVDPLVIDVDPVLGIPLEFGEVEELSRARWGRVRREARRGGEVESVGEDARPRRARGCARRDGVEYV